MAGESEADIARARAKALRWLAARDRSRREIEARLARAGFTAGVAAGVCDWLSELGYLSDERYARALVAARRGSKPAGRRRIRYELQQKGIADDVAQSALADLDVREEARLALDAAQRRLARLGGLDPSVQRRRLAQFLERRGFEAQTVRKTVESLLGEAF